MQNAQVKIAIDDAKITANVVRRSDINRSITASSAQPFFRRLRL